MPTIRGWLATIAVVLASLAAYAQAPLKMTIATGVDPAFSQFYVAKEAGIFQKNGLEVEINTGASGSAMVPFLVNNQIHAAYGSDLAGVLNHLVDPNIVVVADGTYLLHWLAVVGRNIPDLDGLKGKRVGYTLGTSTELFWRALLEKRNMSQADYTMVNIEGPEEVAALERGDVDAFVCWEPWPSRAVMSVKGAKILIDANGILNTRNYIYMNRGWIEKNQAAAERFMRSMVEANDLINRDRPAATAMVSKFLRMPIELTTELMPKVEFDANWTDGSLDTIRIVEKQLIEKGRMKAPLDWNAYVYTDLLKKVRPEAVKITRMPPA
jgi:ABC-type nitrate/sulfonate/bicarbonate transport system substrate-binding protein